MLNIEFDVSVLLFASVSHCRIVLFVIVKLLFS